MLTQSNGITRNMDRSNSQSRFQYLSGRDEDSLKTLQLIQFVSNLFPILFLFVTDSHMTIFHSRITLNTYKDFPLVLRTGKFLIQSASHVKVTGSDMPYIYADFLWASCLK